MSLGPSPSLETMVQVGDFGRKYTWNFVFEDFDSIFNRIIVPHQFKEWFPASDCSITLTSLDQYDVTGGILSTVIPKSAQPRTLSITMYDTYNYSFTKWMYDWRSLIVNTQTGCVLPVVNASCLCKICCYDSVHKSIRYGEYYVIPVDSQDMQFGSDGDAYTFDAEFNIVGVRKELMYDVDSLGN